MALELEPSPHHGPVLCVSASECPFQQSFLGPDEINRRKHGPPIRRLFVHAYLPPSRSARRSASPAAGNVKRLLDRSMHGSVGARQVHLEHLVDLACPLELGSDSR